MFRPPGLLLEVLERQSVIETDLKASQVQGICSNTLSVIPRHFLPFFLSGFSQAVLRRLREPEILIQKGSPEIQCPCSVRDT